MEIIDVLGDDSGTLPGLVERSERPVATAGFCTAELLFHREPPAPAFVPRLLARQKVAKLDRSHLGPDAARRSEVGDAALGRDAGAGERHDGARLLDHFPELADTGLEFGCDHRLSLPSRRQTEPFLSPASLQRQP